MILSIPADKAPLLKYAGSQHLHNIRREELVASLSARGVDIVGGGPGIIVVNLRNLAIANGSLENGKRELLNILRELNVDAVTLQPEDASYLMGANVLSHSIGRGLESSSEGLERLLCDVPITEGETGGDAIPLFDRLDQACDFVMNDRLPTGANAEIVRRGVERDLFANNLLDRVDDTYRNWMDAPPEQAPPAHPDFEGTHRPYKSIFDRSSD